MASRSRIDAARNRAVGLKRVLAATAAVAFAVFGVLARVTNSGHATTRTHSGGSASSSAATRSGDDEAQSRSNGFSIAPSTSQPQAQTGVS